MSNPQTFVKQSGVWHQVQSMWVKVAGVWEQIKEAYANVSGVWQLVYFSFTPFTQDFTTPGTYAPTVPIGASSLTLSVTGGGAEFPIGTGSGFSAPGGSAGGTAIRTIPISQSDWGTAISLVVGSHGSGGSVSSYRYGGDSSGTGTLSGTPFNLIGRGGSRTVSGTNDPNTWQAQGAALGGTTNSFGEAGNTHAGPSNARAGDSFWAQGGAYGYSGPGSPGSLGSGGGGSAAGAPAVGGNGRAKLDWS